MLSCQLPGHESYQLCYSGKWDGVLDICAKFCDRLAICSDGFQSVFASQDKNNEYPGNTKLCRQGGQQLYNSFAVAACQLSVCTLK